MKRLTIFLAIFCIRFGLNSASANAQETITQDTVVEGQNILITEIVTQTKKLATYPKPECSKAVTKKDVISAIKNRNDLVENIYFTDNIFGRLKYLKVIHSFNYGQYYWDKPVQKIMGYNYFFYWFTLVFSIGFFLIGSFVKYTEKDFLFMKFIYMILLYFVAFLSVIFFVIFLEHYQHKNIKYTFDWCSQSPFIKIFLLITVALFFIGHFLQWRRLKRVGK